MGFSIGFSDYIKAKTFLFTFTWGVIDTNSSTPKWFFFNTIPSSTGTVWQTVTVIPLCLLFFTTEVKAWVSKILLNMVIFVADMTGFGLNMIVFVPNTTLWVQTISVIKKQTKTVVPWIVLCLSQLLLYMFQNKQQKILIVTTLVQNINVLVPNIYLFFLLNVNFDQNNISFVYYISVISQLWLYISKSDKVSRGSHILYRWRSINRQNPPNQQHCCNSWTHIHFGFPSKFWISKKHFQPAL